MFLPPRKISISWRCPLKSVYLYFNYVDRLADESGVCVLPAHHVHRPHEPSCRPRHQEYILTFIFKSENKKNLDFFYPPAWEDGRDHTAMKIPFMYSFPGNCAAWVPISTLVCLWAIYIFPGSVHIFFCSKIDPEILEIYKFLTDIWVQELGDRTFCFGNKVLQSFISGNT